MIVGVNLNKPVRMRDGRPARILATDLKGDRPLAVTYTTGSDSQEWPITLLPDGRYYSYRDSEYDLVNIPEERIIYRGLRHSDATIGAFKYSSPQEAYRNGWTEALRITIVDDIVQAIEIVPK
jgi:hypothetical protein